MTGFAPIGDRSDPVGSARQACGDLQKACGPERESLWELLKSHGSSNWGGQEIGRRRSFDQVPLRL